MEFIVLNLEEYKILLFQRNYLLNIYIQGKNKNEKDKIKYKPIQIRYSDKFTEHFSNFKDLIKQINDKAITLIIAEEYYKSSYSSIIRKKHLNCLNLELKNDKLQKQIITKKIFPINVIYYLTEGPNFNRDNIQYYYSYIKTDNFNLEDIKELVDRENLSDKYNIDSYKYYNEEKRIFEEIRNKNIQIKDKITLEFHINGEKNYLINNRNFTQKYLKDEIIRLKNQINKLSDKATKYDLIFLYASPIIQNDKFYTESIAPISYMEEIRIILKLMKNKKNKFKCKFECINDKALKDILSENKTKMLHISAHGNLENQYSLIVENIQKNSELYNLNYNTLKYILNINCINISKLDLVFVSTCYSEDFGKLFLEYGAKNVIYIDKKTEINDKVSVIFTEYFYENLIEGHTIKDSYDNAIRKMKINPEVAKINYKTCCCDHYHESNCSGEDLHYLHQKTSKEVNKNKKLCTCEYYQPNYHNKNNCEYFKEILQDAINEGEIKFENVENDPNTIKICCCDLSIEHNEISKIKRGPELSNYLDVSPFSLNGKGKLIINSNLCYYYEDEKFSSILGRKSLMGKIFENLSNNGKYIILFGEKHLGKVVFSESFCVFLYERRIINSHKIFYINSEIDFNYMINKISKLKENKINNKKNIQIIKFVHSDDINNFVNLIDIYQNFLLIVIEMTYILFLYLIKKKEKKKIMTKKK